MTNKRTWGNSDLKYDPVENVCWYIDSKRGVTRCYGMPTYGLTRERIRQIKEKVLEKIKKKKTAETLKGLINDQH